MVFYILGAIHWPQHHLSTINDWQQAVRLCTQQSWPLWHALRKNRSAEASRWRLCTIIFHSPQEHQGSYYQIGKEYEYKQLDGFEKSLVLLNVLNFQNKQILPTLIKEIEKQFRFNRELVIKFYRKTIILFLLFDIFMYCSSTLEHGL